MPNLAIITPTLTDDFRHARQFCSCCEQPTSWEMVEALTPSRGTAKVGRFHEHCWTKVWRESEVAALNPKYGTQTKDGLEYIQLLYPDQFDVKLHAALIDNASGRKAQWFFMGDCYRSPKFQNGKTHGHFKTIAENCPSGKIVVLVFKDGVLVDRDEHEWDNAKAKASKKKQDDVFLKCCQLVNELANKNREVQVPCDARSKKEKAAAAKARK